MSYICSVCSNTVPVGVSCHKRIVKVRTKHYPYREFAKQEWRLNKKNKWVWTWIPDPGGVGKEIDKEINCCPNCAIEIDKVI